MNSVQIFDAVLNTNEKGNVTEDNNFKRNKVEHFLMVASKTVFFLKKIFFSSYQVCDAWDVIV